MQVDRTLETMFLRVSDGLKDLLEQLEGPFGLTPDKAHEIMADVEPVFDQLERHLNSLIEESHTDTDGEMSAPAAFFYGNGGAADISADDFSSRFQREVALLLRQMLTAFKQPDTAASREELQDTCAHLSAIGEQFDLSAWCDLIETARLAAANLDNDYRTLAPVLIKEIKKSQDLVLSGQAAEIAVSDAMQSLLPADALFAELDTSELGEADLDEADLEDENAGDDSGGLGFDIADMGNADEIAQELEDLSLNGYLSAEAEGAIALPGLDEDHFDASLDAGDAEDDLEGLFDRESEEDSLFDDDLNDELDEALADSSNHELAGDELADFQSEDSQVLVAIAPETAPPPTDDIGRLSVDLEFDEIPLELSTLNRRFDREEKADESLDALLATVNVTGPDVGTEELNSLADLFDGDLDELDNTLGGHPFATVEMQLHPENIDADEADDLADLLADEAPDDTDGVAQAIADADEIEDDLFGGTLTGGEFATVDERELDALDDLALAAEELDDSVAGEDLDAPADMAIDTLDDSILDDSTLDDSALDELTLDESANVPAEVLVSDTSADITADMVALSEDVWADDVFDSADELFNSVEDDLLKANDLAETVGLTNVVAEDLRDQPDELDLDFSAVDPPDAEDSFADPVEVLLDSEKQRLSSEPVAPASDSPHLSANRSTNLSSNLSARAVAAPRQTGPKFHPLAGEALQQAEEDIDSFFLGEATHEPVKQSEESRPAPLNIERSLASEEQLAEQLADDPWGELATEAAADTAAADAQDIDAQDVDAQDVDELSFDTLSVASAAAIANDAFDTGLLEAVPPRSEISHSPDEEVREEDEIWGELTALSENKETGEELDSADSQIDLDDLAPVDKLVEPEEELSDLELSDLEMSLGDEQPSDDQLLMETGFTDEDTSLDLEALLESEPSDVTVEDLFDSSNDSEAEDLLDFDLSEDDAEETPLELTDASSANSDELFSDLETAAGEDNLSEIEDLEIEDLEIEDLEIEDLEIEGLEIEGLEIEESEDDSAEESLHRADESSDDEFDSLDLMLSEETGEQASGEQEAGEHELAEADDGFGEADDGFDDLESLLAEETVEESTPDDTADSLPAAEGEMSALEETVLADAEDFGDLERLLEDRVEGHTPALTRLMPPRLARRGSGLREQNMRVSVNHLDNLSNLVGELVVSRNTLERDQERLRQFLDNLLFQVQQLNDVGQRMRDLYERSLLESSLMSNRRAYSSASNRDKEATGHATGATFDALEMDRFTGFHTLSQEMIELIVRVRESASDIGYTVESSDQVTRQFRQITTQLQEGLNTARMIAFAQAADRLPRAVRDISLKCGKEARLVVEGQDTLIDKMIVEHLYDPLTHLVNNAITHGIETPAARRAAGKSSEGTITVRAFYQGNQTVIYVADDGGGIDTDLVKRKAMEQALIGPAEAEALSAIEIYELLFHPGFSTRDRADDFAGRGVGMDVVRTSLAEIRGSITIDSEQGKGTSFTIRLPLTLSISKALSCVSNQARIAFPMDGVEDMLDVSRDRIIKNDQDQDCVRWRDTLLPFQPITDLLKFNRTLGRGRVYGGGHDEDVLSIIVLRSANTFVAVQVDQVIGEQEIVIKQLEGPVPKPLGIAGATVLGDGRVMPIADVLELIDIAMGRIRREPASLMWSQEAVTEAPIKRDPTVLIVDDSITVRELLSMSFSKIGYRVEQARDGQEAWDKLRSGLPCDLVFCDIEMPRMDGLELLSRMQKDTQLKRIPIAMLTSRGADRHRQMAVDLGASGYFTKPYLEEALLDAAQRMLNGETLAKGRGG